MSPSRDAPLLAEPQLWKEAPHPTLHPPILGENGFLEKSREAAVLGQECGEEIHSLTQHVTEHLLATGHWAQ